jgi:predicted SnoaL-like aldol condensation-catalyzing enzyme
MSETKRIARVWFDEVINKHNLGALDEYYAEDYIYHNEDGSVTTGRDFAKQIATRLIESVPDRVATVHEQLAEGDLVATRWSSTGTHTGVPIMGHEPSGEAVTAWGLVISRIESGRVAEDWELVRIDFGGGTEPR